MQQRATSSRSRPQVEPSKLPARFVVSTRAYSMPASLTVVLPTTLYGGSIVVYVTGSSSLQLQMPDHTVWRYDYR